MTSPPPRAQVSYLTSEPDSLHGVWSMHIGAPGLLSSRLCGPQPPYSAHRLTTLRVVQAWPPAAEPLLHTLDVRMGSRLDLEDDGVDPEGNPVLLPPDQTQIINRLSHQLDLQEIVRARELDIGYRRGDK